MWWGISYWTLAGLGAVSVRLGGRWHLQRRPRQPYLFCPVLCRALCSGSRAFSRLVCVGAAERWEGSLAWRGGLAWWVATNGAHGNPTSSFPPSLRRTPYSGLRASRVVFCMGVAEG